jgi:hypothetical protein
MEKGNEMKGNKAGLIAVAALVLVGLLCVGFLAYKGLGGSGTGTQIEQEDCDAEDFRNREADCGFIQTKAPVVVKTTKGTAPKQPAPRVTRN